MFKLLWDADLPFEKKRMLPEIAAVLGMHSEVAKFPIVTDVEEAENCVIKLSQEVNELVLSINNSEIRLPYDCDISEICTELVAKLSNMFGKSQEKVPHDYLPTLKSAKALPKRYERDEIGLECLFKPGFVLFDDNCDGLPDRIDVKILCPQQEDTLKAACDFAFRLGMETTSLSLPLLVNQDDGVMPLLCFKESGTPSIELVSKEPRVRIDVCGSGAPLREFISDFCEHFGMAGEGQDLEDCCEQLLQSANFENSDGQLTYLGLAGDGAKGKSIFISHTDEDILKKAVCRWPNTQIRQYQEPELVCEKEFRFAWEYDEALSALNEFLPKISAGDQIKIDAALSESKEVRNRFLNQAVKLIEKKGATVVDGRVLCAYKQAYSWIEESVVPALLHMDKKPVHLNIMWKPFLKPGTEDWGDNISGVEPLKSLQGEKEEKWLDLPIRPLQDIYPIDDVIAPKLGISRDAIDFSVYEGEEDISYVCTATDENGDVLRRECFKSTYSQRPYLNDFPDMGIVHPYTGYIRLWVNDKEELNVNIATDLERVWDAYQTEVLPYCRHFAEEKCGGQLAADKQPFFGKLEMDVGISEPEYRIGVREELFSPLDGFNEDLYFCTGDYFSACGDLVGEDLMAPGGVVPYIHIREGGASLTFRLYRQVADKPCADFITPIPCSSVNVTRVEPGLNIYFSFAAKEGISPFLREYAQIIEADLSQVARKLHPYYKKITLCEGKKESAACLLCDDRTPIEKNKDINDIEIPADEIIDPEKYMDIVDQLRHVRGLTVINAGKSYLGREIPAFILGEETDGYHSRVRKISKGPVLLLTAGHHANEVSGTNGLLRVIKKLLSDEKYKGLAEEMTLVFLPLKNPDGGAILKQLCQEHSGWKYHCARYNAIGFEYGLDYFNRNSIHGEALALLELYLRWLPDATGDFHGVPTHEWEQQFSGYASPHFKGFWLPRAFLHGYYQSASDSQYDWNRKLSDACRKALMISQQGDAAIDWYNSELQDRHMKYARKWMPNLYQVCYEKGVVNYIFNFPEDANNHMANRKLPWITALDYVGEVTDEVANGEFLRLCTKVEELQILAFIDRLRKTISVRNQEVYKKDHVVYFTNMRLRPLVAE